MAMGLAMEDEDMVAANLAYNTSDQNDCSV
jgi:hypothetical protein